MPNIYKCRNMKSGFRKYQTILQGIIVQLGIILAGTYFVFMPVCCFAEQDKTEFALTDNEGEETEKNSGNLLESGEESDTLWDFEADAGNSAVSMASAAGETGCVVSVENEEYLRNIPVVTIIQNTAQNNDALLEVILELQTVNAKVRLSEGATETITLPVVWTIGESDSPQIDVSVPGQYQERGKITLPEGYVFDENILQEIIIPVDVVVPSEPVEITSIDFYPELSDAYAFLLGTDISEIKNSCSPAEYWNCYDDSGNVYIAEILWDYSRINIEIPGVYEVTGEIILPENTVFSKDFLAESAENFVFPISIQKPGEPEINCCFAGRGKFCFPWTAPPGSLDEIMVKISEDDGEWQNYTRNNSHMYWDRYQLLIDAELFTEGKSYRLQVEYEGGKTKILSFEYKGCIYITAYNEGDRDGGDVNVLNPDKPPSEEPSSEEPPTDDSSLENSGLQQQKEEATGEVYDIVSGEQLLLMLGFSGSAQFSQQGVSVSLPEQTVLDTNPEDEDMFKVSIIRKSRSSFFFSVWKNGKHIENLFRTKVLLPWKSKADHFIFLLNKNHIPVSLGNYSREKEILSFYVDAGGDYTIYELPETRKIFSGLFHTAFFLWMQFCI